MSVLIDNAKPQEPSSLRNIAQFGRKNEMWKCWDKYFVVEPYHDTSFRCDEARQAEMRSVAMRKDRRIMSAFVLMAGAFGVTLLSGFLWFIPGLGTGAVAFVGSFLFSIVLLLSGRPRFRCSRCGHPMTTEWGPIQNGRDGEYQVCPACRLYVFNYRMSR